MLGCDETSCFVEIAGALGSDYLVMGTVSVIKDVFALSVKLVNATSGLPAAQAYERFQSKSGVELFDAAERAAAKIISALRQEEAKARGESVTAEGSELEETAEPESGISPLVWVAGGMAVAGLAAGVTGSVMYLGAESDLDRLVQAVKLSRDIFATEAFSEWMGDELMPGPEVQTDEELREFVRGSADSYHHQAGSCKMGSDEMAVVDPQLRVYGIEGLRVADASVFPVVPSGNCHSGILVIGEKCADMIKADHGLS